MQNYTKLKDKGNDLFKQKKFNDAISTFQSAIDLIHNQQPKEAINSLTQVGKLYVILNINSAFAALNLKTKQSYQRAAKYCDTALQIESTNQKGLYRRALANKELAELLEIQSNGTSQELLQLYNRAKKDLEDLTILDRTNEIAKQKLSEVIKNIYRVTVTQGKQVPLSSSSKEQVSKPKAQYKTETKVVHQKPVIKKPDNMNKILKEYKVDEVTTLARQKIENHYLTQELPKTRAQLQKAIREIEKSEEVFLKFIYRLSEEYLKKIQPTFDILFQLVNAIVKRGEGEQGKNAILILKAQKSFDLLWKSYTGGEKKSFRQKWESFGLSPQQLK